jgi:hypothetical protein
MAARRTPTSQNGVVAALKFVFTGTRTLGGIAQTLAGCDEGAEGLDLQVARNGVKFRSLLLFFVRSVPVSVRPLAATGGTMKACLSSLMLILSLAACAGTLKDESFAREMLTCGHRHSQVGFLPGPASIAEKARQESGIFMTAATLSSDKQFVEKESPLVEKAVTEELLAKLQGPGTEAEFMAWVSEHEQHCKDRLRAFMAKLSESGSR